MGAVPSSWEDMTAKETAVEADVTLVADVEEDGKKEDK
jgi:hypothetical protein